MSYRQHFDQTIRAVLDRCPLGGAGHRELWPESLSEEGVAYGQSEDLPAGEAATWYLSAAALIRMCDGQLGVPFASRLLRAARSLARERDMGADLLQALARMEEERHDWILANHEYQGAGLRDLDAARLGGDGEHAVTPPPDWPDILDRLLHDPRRV